MINYYHLNVLEVSKFGYFSFNSALFFYYSSHNFKMYRSDNANFKLLYIDVKMSVSVYVFLGLVVALHLLADSSGS
jgi:hypothetical protein